MIKLCKFCGASIIYIKNPNGKYVPADEATVLYVPDKGGSDLIVTKDGLQLRARIVKDATLYGCKRGHRSHFVTCPVPESVRREQENRRNAKKVQPKRTAPMEQTKLWT